MTSQDNEFLDLMELRLQLSSDTAVLGHKELQALIFLARRSLPTEGLVLPERPSKEHLAQFHSTLISLNYIQWADFVRYDNAMRELLRSKEVELAGAKEENEKLDGEVQAALGTNGLLFHLMRRLGLECSASPDGTSLYTDARWRNVRAETAEAALASRSNKHT